MFFNLLSKTIKPINQSKVSDHVHQIIGKLLLLIKSSLLPSKSYFSDFVNIIPAFVELGLYGQIANFYKSESENTCNLGLKETFKSLADYYNSLQIIDKKISSNSTEQIFTTDGSIERYMNVIPNDIFEIEKTPIFEHVDNFLNNINSKNIMLDFKSLVGELTIRELFGLPYEDDELLMSMDSEYSRCVEINKRIKQILTAIDDYNLTANDVLEIIGNIKINYLMKIFPRASKEYRLEKNRSIKNV